MTPEQKLKWAVLAKVAGWDKKPAPEYPCPNVDELYDALVKEGAYLFRNRQTGERYSLRRIPPGPARRNEALPACSFFCEMAEMEYAA